MEARYGAFCCLRHREDGKRKLVGKPLESFTIYAVPSTAPPTIVASLRESAEIVLFGKLTPLSLSKPIIGPNGLMLAPDPEQSGQVRISRFQPQREDRRVRVPGSIASVVKGISDVGGNYGDAIAILRLAKDRDELQEQLAIDPLPKSRRTYFRNNEDSEANETGLDAAESDDDPGIGFADSE